MGFGSDRQPVLDGIRKQARVNYAKAALRWHCNDYPYAALVSMIDARARALQLKGVRARETTALPAVRGIETVVDVAALWSLGNVPMMTHASPSSPLLGESAVRAKAAGFLGPEGEYIRTNLVNRRPPDRTAPTLILNPCSRPGGLAIDAITAAQLADLTQLAQRVFSIGDRTVLALSDGVDESFAFETWAVLANGGTVDIIDDSTADDATMLVEHLNESVVDLVHLTPPAFQILSNAKTTCAAAAGVRDVILPDDAGAANGLVARYFPSAKIHHFRHNPGNGQIGSLVNCA